MSEQTQRAGALIVNTWSVQDGLQDEFVAGLTDLFEHVRTVAGFLHGQILQGANTTRYISVVVMRSTLLSAIVRSRTPRPGDSYESCGASLALTPTATCRFATSFPSATPAPSGSTEGRR